MEIIFTTYHRSIKINELKFQNSGWVAFDSMRKFHVDCARDCTKEKQRGVVHSLWANSVKGVENYTHVSAQKGNNMLSH
jgi:hypothetical protein